MIRTQICLVAEGVTIDAESQALSIFSVLEGIQAEGFPVLIQRATFLCVLLRDEDDPAEHQARFIAQVAQTEIVSHNVLVNFATKRKSRVIVRMQMVVPHPGALLMKLMLGDHSVGEYSIEVSQRAPVVEAPPIAQQLAAPVAQAAQRPRPAAKRRRTRKNSP